MTFRPFFGVLFVLVIACGVPDAPPPSGGVSLAPRNGACPRGFAVVSSDYASSSVALLSQSGMILSAAVISSGAVATGSSSALSGDVVGARETWSSDSFFVIDRYPNAVATRIKLASGTVAAQRSLATGFASKPHDVIELGDGRAYVARYGTNPKVGREDFDGGSDLLVIDARSLSVTGRIDLGMAGDPFPARPDRLLRFGDLVLVLLGRIDAAFKQAGPARIAAIDPKTDSVAWTADLGAVQNCGAFALSQDGTKLAVACTGVFASGAGQLDASDVVVFDAAMRPLSLPTRLGLAQSLGAPLAPAVAFDDDRLLGIAYGDEASSHGDVVYGARGTDAPKVIATAGKAFVFGDVVCGCDHTCLFSDAERGTVRRLKWNGVSYDELPETKIAGAAGLPPRTFGAL
ncbi:hypothetical protein BH09MYX1_BH09MYX1_08700 [soil metagenome]